MHRPSRNLVVASDSLPAHFRPANQIRLVRSAPANPSPSDPGAWLPGMGEMRFANGISSNGLQSGSADGRFLAALAGVRAAEAQRLAMLQRSGGASAPSRPVQSLPLTQALAALPVPPVATPIIERDRVELVERLDRPNGTHWKVTKISTPEGNRFAVSLYRTRGKHVDLIVRSDNLASLRDAREYIRAYEVRRGDVARVGAPKRVAYWNSILRRGAVNAGGALQRMSLQRVKVINTPAPQAPDAYQPSGNVSNVTRHEARMLAIDGLGDVATQPLVIGALAIGALYCLHRMKRA